jgi:hypothetical protein
MNWPVSNKVRQLNNNASPFVTPFWVDLGHSTQPTLIDHPACRASDMDGTIVSG